MSRSQIFDGLDEEEEEEEEEEGSDDEGRVTIPGVSEAALTDVDAEF